MSSTSCTQRLAPGHAATSTTSQKSLAAALGAFDLEGRVTDPIAAGASRATVLLFVRNDCPISNRYAPEIRRLQSRFGPEGVRFWLVHPVAEESPQSIRQQAREYELKCDLLRDPNQFLVRRAKVRVTPEAAVFSAAGDLIYHGRIDDRFVDFGKERPAPTQHDLEQVLSAVLAGKMIAHAATRAVGCYIPELP